MVDRLGIKDQTVWYLNEDGYCYPGVLYDKQRANDMGLKELVLKPDTHFVYLFGKGFVLVWVKVLTKKSSHFIFYSHRRNNSETSLPFTKNARIV